MSKRFGRNQRRRAREALAAAASEAERFKAAHQMTQGLLSHVAEAKRKIEEELAEAKEMAYTFSALFPPECVRDKREAHPDNRLQLAPQQRCEVMSLTGPENMAMTFKSIDLPSMLTTITSDAMNDAVHVLVQYDGGRWAYHVERRTLQRMGRSRATKEVSDYLAKAICADLLKA
jgi:hypothetical protein